MWSIARLIGTRAAVIRELQANDKVPEPMKACLVDCVNGLPAEVTGARVDAHAQKINGGMVAHLTVMPLAMAKG